jgi:hypothetical protein
LPLYAHSLTLRFDANDIALTFNANIGALTFNAHIVALTFDRNNITLPVGTHIVALAFGTRCLDLRHIILCFLYAGRTILLTLGAAFCLLLGRSVGTCRLAFGASVLTLES